MKSKSSKINIDKKLKYLFILIGIVLIVSFSTSTFSRLKNRTSYNQIDNWDGSVASSFRSGTGTLNDPYIISNASEFEYFLKSLNTTSYDSNTYVKLGADIVINNGTFSYNDNTIKYTKKNGKTCSITPYTNDCNGYNINTVTWGNNFNGNFDGNSFRIYGLYITSNTKDDVALFNTLGGNFENVYIENELVYGGKNTAGIAINFNGNNISTNNVLVNGYVLSNQLSTVKLTKNYNDISGSDNIVLDNYEATDYAILKGNFLKTDENSILEIGNKKIDREGAFSIEVDPSDIQINAGGVLSNLELKLIDGNYIASGFYINANNSNINNCINKAYVNGSSRASGFINNYKNERNEISNFNNSYDVGSINSYGISTSLISNIEGKNINIKNSYSNSNLKGYIINPLLGKIYAQDSSYNNIFTTDSTNYAIEYLDNSVSNFSEEIYSLNSNLIINKNITPSVLINSKNEMINKFNSKVKNDDNWICNENKIPSLVIDDINNSIISINVGNYAWNNFTTNVNTLNFKEYFVFKITQLDTITDIKSIEYYVSNSSTPLGKTEVESNDITWIKYNDIVKYTTRGDYIIYAKVVLNDSNNTTNYINSDVISLDTDTNIFSAQIGTNTWNKLNDNLKYKYLNKNRKLKVEFDDKFTSSNLFSYIKSNKELTYDELENLNTWEVIKNNTISVNNSNPVIYYIRCKDYNGIYHYVSTDFISVNGYTQSNLILGRNEYTSNTLNISSNSSITTRFKFNSEKDIEGEKYLVSNIKLPINTKILLNDVLNNKKYVYIVSSDNSDLNLNDNKFRYNLNMFKEINNMTPNYFNNGNYIANTQENYEVTFDFEGSDISSDIVDLSIHLEIINNNDILLSTLKNKIKTFNIYVNSNRNVNIKLDSTIDAINYNSDSLNKLSFTFKSNNITKNNKTIYDSTSNDKKNGIEIFLYNQTNNEIMKRKYLSNVDISNNGIIYEPNVDGKININLGKKLNNEIDIQTHTTDNKLIDGDYSFVICPYESYDGITHENIDMTKCKFINVVKGSSKPSSTFDVKFNNNDRIIYKNTSNKMAFDILQMNKYTHPNIKISLYEKEQLTAYNQNYKLVDLSEYITNNLTKYINNKYYLDNNATYSTSYKHYELDLNIDAFSLNGYKLVFEFYDDNILKGTIEEKFIVKAGGE